MKELELKVYEINEIMRKIDNYKFETQNYGKYIDYINRNGVNHIGFDCSNKYHTIEHDKILNDKVTDLLVNHYKLEIEKLETKIKELFIELSKKIN